MGGSEKVLNYADVMQGWSQNAKPALVVITVFFCQLSEFQIGYT